MERKYQLLDFWILAQRETIHRQFKEGNNETNIANFEFLVRQSLFKMKIDRTPLFRAFLYNQLFDSPDSWREIRKIFRKFLIKIRKYQNLHSSVNFLEKLTPVFQETVGWFQSQFITWGIVMPHSLMDDSMQSIDNLIQLFGVSIDQGYSEIVQPLYSAIIEKSTKFCVDHINEYFNDRLSVKKWRDKEAVEKKIKSMIGRNPFRNIIKFKVSGSYGKVKFKIKIDDIEKKNHIETLGKSILSLGNMRELIFNLFYNFNHLHDGLSLLSLR